MKETEENLWPRFYSRQEIEASIMAAELELLQVGGIFDFLRPVYGHISSVRANLETRVRMGVDRVLKWRAPVNKHGAYLLVVSKKAHRRDDCDSSSSVQIE